MTPDPSQLYEKAVSRRDATRLRSIAKLTPTVRGGAIGSVQNLSNWYESVILAVSNSKL
jgi:hypothetical protein